MGQLSKEKFNELRDKVASILKEADLDYLDAPKICAAALNSLESSKEMVYAIRAIPSVFVEAPYGK